jgi:hypothetical protein
MEFRCFYRAPILHRCTPAISHWRDAGMVATLDGRAASLAKPWTFPARDARRRRDEHSMDARYDTVIHWSTARSKGMSTTPGAVLGLSLGTCCGRLAAQRPANRGCIAASDRRYDAGGSSSRKLRGCLKRVWPNCLNCSTISKPRATSRNRYGFVITASPSNVESPTSAPFPVEYMMPRLGVVARKYAPNSVPTSPFARRISIIAKLGGCCSADSFASATVRATPLTR